MPNQPIPYAGDKGAVGNGSTALSAVGEWSVSVKAENQLVVNSSTAGGALRLAGNEDWSGRYRANGAVPAFSPGAAFTFIGSIDGVNGVTGTAIVDSVKIDADIAGGKPWTHEVAFSANGPLSFGPAAAVDASVGIPPSSIGTQVQLSARRQPLMGSARSGDHDFAGVPPRESPVRRLGDRRQRDAEVWAAGLDHRHRRSPRRRGHRLRPADADERSRDRDHLAQ